MSRPIPDPAPPPAPIVWSCERLAGAIEWSADHPEYTLVPARKAFLEQQIADNCPNINDYLSAEGQAWVAANLDL